MRIIEYNMFANLSSLMFVTGCLSPANVQCIENANCNRFTGGICTMNALTRNQWCTYPDPNCAGGRRWSDLSVGDGVSGTCVDPSLGAMDAGIDADTRRWSQPTMIFSMATSFDEGVPVISPDRRELIMGGPQQAGSLLGDVYFYSRVLTSEPWDPSLRRLDAVNTTQASEYPSCISSEGLELIFTRAGELFSVHRSSTVAPWETPMPLGFRGSIATLTSDDLTIYYDDVTVSCPTGKCRQKRTRSSRASSWSAPVTVSFPDGGGYQMLDIAADELSIILSAPITPALAPVAITTRPSTVAPWGDVNPISELSIYSKIRGAQRNWTGDEMYLAIGDISWELYLSRLE